MRVIPAWVERCVPAHTRTRTRTRRGLLSACITRLPRAGSRDLPI